MNRLYIYIVWALILCNSSLLYSQGVQSEVSFKFQAGVDNTLKLSSPSFTLVASLDGVNKYVMGKYDFTELAVNNNIADKNKHELFSKEKMVSNSDKSDRTKDNTDTQKYNRKSVNKYEYNYNDFVTLDENTFGQQFKTGCKIWGGVGFGMMAVLLALPRSVTKWQGDFVNDAMHNLERAYTTPPVWDQDHWQLNYVGHPIAGSMYYNTIRAQAGTPFNSFLFSAFISTVWEYGFEATAERPSIQDLIVTPVSGALIGELAHIASLKMRENGFNFFEKIAVTIINPMYVIINGYH